MSNDTTVYTLYPEAHADERLRYYDGQFLTSQDFVDEQRYHADRLRRALDHLTVSGVAEGLELAPSAAWKVKLSAGAAIDGAGRQLVVPAARDNIDVPRDIAGGVLDVALLYAEAESRLHGGTSDEDGTRGATRWREVPALEFYAQGAQPSRPDAVPLARLRVSADGAITVDNPNPVRRATGLRLPSSGDPAAAPSLRAGWARPGLAVLTGDLQTTGRLGVGTPDPESELDVRGLARLGYLSVREHPFTVGGDEATFYPIPFKDNDWAAGVSVLEIFRTNAQADAANAGVLFARMRMHNADGQGAELWDVEVVQSRRFIANAAFTAKDRTVIVWLRGNRTYAWRSLQRVEIGDTAAGSKTIAGQKFDPRTTIEPAYDRDRLRWGPVLDHRDLRSSLNVAGDVSYTGKLDHLDVADRPGAVIRAHDLIMGHSTRRGEPGRALVDNKSSLMVNYNADWPLLILNSKTQVSGDLVVDKITTLSGGVTGDVKLNDGGLNVAKGATLGDNVRITRDAEHLTLYRNKATTGGVKMFLELYQLDGSTPEVFPAIRFHHNNRYWHRLEARGSGLHVRTGDLGNDGYSALFASDMTAAGTLNASGDVKAGGHLTAGKDLKVTGSSYLDEHLTVGKDLKISGSTTIEGVKVNKWAQFADNIRVTRDAEHMTLWRPKSATGDWKLFLELFQEDGATPETYPSIRFHHSNRYWHRLEARGDGLHVRHGDGDGWKALSAGDMNSNGRAVMTGHSERLRLVRGTITSGGGVARGSGWSVAKENGVWKVTFSPAFSDVPVVVATQQYPDSGGGGGAGGSTRDNAVIVDVNASTAWIKTGDGDGDQSWRRVHFIAIGQ